VAVQGFLNGEIGFLDIIRVVSEALDRTPRASVATVEDVIAVDREARALAGEQVVKFRGRR
jgi:1-deoxy-D-xylulose-5-phosphate reductoisomerase